MSSFDDDGYAIVERVLDAAQCEAIIGWLGESTGDAAGSRNVLDAPWCRVLAAAVRTQREIRPLLADGAVAVQCTLFDKSPARNWLVAAHQDVSIPVRERVVSPRYTGWSRKEGVLYVQPPLPILEALTAVRIHLDAFTSENGPLRVVPGSHRLGRLESGQIARRRPGEVECPCPRGGARPYRAGCCTSSSGRRTCPTALPGIRWSERVGGAGCARVIDSAVSLRCA